MAGMETAIATRVSIQSFVHWFVTPVTRWKESVKKLAKMEYGNLVEERSVNVSDRVCTYVHMYI